jgi:hypothetical protein
MAKGVAISSTTGDGERAEAKGEGGEAGPAPTCVGKFMHHCVWISRPADMTWFYRKGFFGKGFLSKSEPEYAKMVSPPFRLQFGF